jgi:hypothetical protein
MRTSIPPPAHLFCSHASLGDAKRRDEEEATCSELDCCRLLLSSSRYGRMAPLRLMGCDWNHRALDQVALPCQGLRVREEFIFIFILTAYVA